MKKLFQAGLGQLLGGAAAPQHLQTSRPWPRATHSARWMSQVLYSQKIYMWADQMNHDNVTVSELHRLVTFLVLFYVPAWLKCRDI